jgi:hypothetical protein
MGDEMTISASQSASREEFERYAKRLGFYGGPTMRDDWDLWQGAWQASRAAALEEAAEICDGLYSKPVHYFADECAEFIRAEIKEQS